MKDNHQEDSWEDDPVWKLVDTAEPTKAGPAFAQDVMRKVRQSEAEPKQPWWKSLCAPVPLTAGALAVAALIMFMVSFPGTTPQKPGIAQDNPETPPQEQVIAQEIDEALDQELLIAAVEDPTLFSDEELLAMLY